MQREIIDIISGKPTSDGAGIKLTRVFSGKQAHKFDPFLMLDEFNSDDADDYIAGFPAHPHRGFEAVAYMLQGSMYHQDHLGNQGKLESGDVQWMTAGRGIIHSEMPQQEAGKLHGFQLWINLPKAEKMKPATYQDIPDSQIPCYTHGGVNYKLIAGEIELAGEWRHGAVTGLASQALYIDLHFSTIATAELSIPDGHTALLYLYQGEADIGAGRQLLEKGELAQLSHLGSLTLHATADTRILLLAGKPLKEPISQHGPFVMNTPEEVEQAISDYRDGTLTAERA